MVSVEGLPALEWWNHENSCRLLQSQRWLCAYDIIRIQTQVILFVVSFNVLVTFDQKAASLAENWAPNSFSVAKTYSRLTMKAHCSVIWINSQTVSPWNCEGNLKNVKSQLTHRFDAKNVTSASIFRHRSAISTEIFHITRWDISRKVYSMPSKTKFIPRSCASNSCYPLIYSFTIDFKPCQIRIWFVMQR